MKKIILPLIAVGLIVGSCGYTAKEVKSEEKKEYNNTEQKKMENTQEKSETK